ncbi:hypothetical protein PC123_g8677 [Phytophthora cactorum]|nr:hypothetical protein PC120_g8611 [Phytophthora cactorum]KAG4056268.1 hypothetical protein PC123_g8677 [Phytophthora cactorum]
MPSASPSKIVLRVRRPPDNNQQAQDLETEPLSPIAANGIILGTGVQANCKLRHDPEVDAAHGTLERTSGLGVWVYSDHSREGSILNNEHKVHNSAVVVRHGDKLKLGQTEIELCLKMGKIEATPEEEDDDAAEKEQVSPVGTNQEIEMGTTRLARRRASTPWGSAGSVTKAQQAKQRLPRIDTSGLNFQDGSMSTVQPMATPPEYTASPVPGMRWRRKRNSIATTTLMARLPSPPLEQHGHPHSFHRSRTRFVQGTDTPLTPPEEENTGKPARPPPLEYSSSPIVSPSSIATRQRHNIFQQPPSSLPVPKSGLIAGVPPPPISAGARPTARRDDLRIQVSKKMAAAAPTSAGKAKIPQVIPKALEFQAPASPVAQRDILKQQESLQTILQHKSEEEQLLKQQQEEWMRENRMASDSPGSSTSTPALSPIKRESKSLADIDPDELATFPAPAPVLLRTLSLGIDDQRTIRPSPRLTAAIRASRARLNSFEEKLSGPKHHDSKGRRKTTALAFSPSIRFNHEGVKISPVKENELRTSDESIASTATTVITYHRRVTSSFSSGSASSVDLCDFVGYEQEEDTEDVVTSYTSPDLYGSDELLRRSREDTTLLFNSNRNNSGSLYGTLSPPQSNISSTLSPSSAADTRLGSPRRRGTDTPDTSSSSSNQLLNDIPVPSFDIAIPLGSRVLSPRGGHFDPRSPYKSTAALQNNQLPQLQKLRRPIEDANVEGKDASEPRQPKPQPFRRLNCVPLPGSGSSAPSTGSATETKEASSAEEQKVEEQNESTEAPTTEETLASTDSETPEITTAAETPSTETHTTTGSKKHFIVSFAQKDDRELSEVKVANNSSLALCCVDKVALCK